MPFLEFLSIIYAVYTWHKELAGTALELQSDCDPVVQAIQRGYSDKPKIHQLIRVLIHITTSHSIFISCAHLPGALNAEADALSRSARTSAADQAQLLTDSFFSLPSVQYASLHAGPGGLVHCPLLRPPSMIWPDERRH